MKRQNLNLEDFSQKQLVQSQAGMKLQLLILKNSKQMMEIQIDFSSIKESELELLEDKKLSHTGNFYMHFQLFYERLSQLAMAIIRLI